MERRELFSFLSSSLKGEKREIIIRPPYYDDINAFDTECLNCDGKCATLCQEQIIIIGEDKTPRLDFSISGCTYCDDCATACEYDVLHVENKKHFLKSGMYVSVNATAKEKEYLTLPTTAVIRKNGAFYAFVAGEYEGEYEPTLLHVKVLNADTL
jgi:MinD superfamily P-loop ATPase